MVLPHGGKLIDRTVDGDLSARSAAAGRLPKLSLDDRSLCDVICIATGAYSPLEGFMGSADYHAVVDGMRLANRTIWPIPIVLPAEPSVARQLGKGSRAALVDGNGVIIATIDVSEIYRADHPREAKSVYGTADTAHPGVAAMLESSDTYVAGTIDLVAMPTSEFPAETMTPAQTRQKFTELGWRSIVAFQTRNPVHRAHEYLQKVALEIVDGLLLHPLVGTTKGDDIPADVRMRCYRVLLQKYYPPGRTVLSVFPAAMRYAGPREAVLHAIARKNYGCTHFIVGRDHAGVGSYYGTFDAQRIFDDIEGELGITILRFEHSFWCNICEGMATAKTCPHGKENHVALSGTKVRDMLRGGERPPQEFSRPEVADVLIDAMKAEPAPVS
ncbi:MAG: sulfate adenylyltransferase [Candidatus Eremiobacteraeota bacterium]|nr:sulfate adenylyltransferase [Candidatus Eremiobacteraeota bacterium]MBC5826209.1 sulfate adenylyltransferase [Candidatus Eremiobacteraeota bacterium]